MRISFSFCFFVFLHSSQVDKPIVKFNSIFILRMRCSSKSMVQGGSTLYQIIKDRKIMKKKKSLLKTAKWKTIADKKSYLEELMANEKKDPISYVKEDTYQMGDYINHSKFGEGFVLNIMTKTKIEVFFKDSERIMLQNWS